MPTPRLVLACLAALLVVWPLTMQKPGLPTWLKADEPAYYLAALSLWQDHDLRCERKDLRRAYDEFLVDPDNLILMTRDGWQTAYYGKPYFTSLVVSPLVAVFGANGFVAFNMACLLAAVALGYRLLRERNREGESMLFAAGYFLVSAGFAYVFWLQPECSSLAAVSAALYLSLAGDGSGAAAGPSPDGPGLPPATPAGRNRRRRRDAARRAAWRLRLLWAGLLLGPAINAKPVHLVAVIPGTLLLLSRRRLKAAALFAAATAAGTLLVAGGQKVLTGTWSSYLGVERQAYNIRSPETTPWERPAPVTGPGGSVRVVTPSNSGSWHWIFRVPDVSSRLWTDLRYYFFGRHSGVFIFYPFFLVAVLLFIAGGPRDAAQIGALVGLALFVLFFVLLEPFNYQGGGGFIGNRYFVGAYPLGLCLVGRLRPRLTLLGFLLGGTFIGQVLFAPLGPPVDEPTLQAYARAIPFRYLPYEFTLNEIPGYRGVTQAGAWLQGRKDRMRRDGEWLTFIGAGTSELIFRSLRPTASAVFLVRDYAPGNQVELRAGRRKARLSFPDERPPEGGFSEVAALDLGRPDVVYRSWYDQPLQYAWYLQVETSHAASPSWWGLGGKAPIGLQLVHLGPREVLDRDVYGAAWEDLETPSVVVAGEPVQVRGCLANRSPETWLGDSLARVQLGYRWLDGKGQPARVEGRAALPLPIRPGEVASVDFLAVTPAEPGDYRLVLEPVNEYVRWFGEVDPESRREVEVRVRPRPGGAAR